jgi:methylated-DNA-[protein]-cysteine S-methyltransferase
MADPSAVARGARVAGLTELSGRLRTAVVPSELVGAVLVRADDTLVRRVLFGSGDTSGGSGGSGGTSGGPGGVADTEAGSLAATAAAELAEYLAGSRESFTVRPDWARLDATSERVLRTLVRIAPFGHTVSYGELAAAADLTDPVAARMTGQILNANPWPVVVPCHRVVMADGSLGGFGSGLWRKEALLRHEGVLPATLFGP